MKHFILFAPLVLLVASMVMAQDDPADQPTQASPLEDLGWMVGQWVDEGENSKIITTCSWAHNDQFLKRSFSITMDGEETLEGTQMIGWDPIAGEIHSWTFDSAGGIGQGRWLRDGDRWLVKTSFTLASGERASAINVITYVDPNTFRWQSTNREVGGELMPNIPEVTVVRQQPEPVEQVSAGDAAVSIESVSSPCNPVRSSRCGCRRFRLRRCGWLSGC